MNPSDIIIAVLFFIILITASVLIGRYMAAVFSGERTFLTPVMRPVERAVYRVCMVDENREQSWKEYALGFTIFNLIGIALLMALQMVQGALPLNPRHLPGVRWDTAFNTAVSFVTNTNWQSYVPESSVSYLTQMAGLAVQNFLSAAIGMAVALPLVRSFTRRESATVGNLWVDMTRAVLYVLLPLSIIVCVILISQGVVQTLGDYATVSTIEHGRQVIPLGPAASQVAIKQLGSNGGGFFNANSAHPLENPTFLANLVETYAILLLPMAFVFMFGFMLKNARQGRALFYAMLLLFVPGPRGHLRGRAAAQSLSGSHRPVRPGEHGGQGNQVRCALVGALERVDHGHVERLGELHA